MTWDTTVPAGSDAISSGDDVIRQLKTDLQTSFLCNNVTLGNEGVFPVNTANPQYRYRGLKGTTAQRPAAGNNGLYYNTDTGTLQRDNGSTWDDISFTPRAGFFYSGNVSTTDVYLIGSTNTSTVETGFVTHRAGSIIGFTVGGVTTSFTSSYTVIFRIRKNGSDVLVASSLNWTANNQNKDTTGTAAIGANPFIAGDRIEVFADFQSGNAIIISRAYVELALTT